MDLRDTGLLKELHPSLEDAATEWDVWSLMNRGSAEADEAELRRAEVVQAAMTGDEREVLALAASVASPAGSRRGRRAWRSVGRSAQVCVWAAVVSIILMVVSTHWASSDLATASMGAAAASLVAWGVAAYASCNAGMAFEDFRYWMRGGGDVPASAGALTGRSR